MKNFDTTNLIDHLKKKHPGDYEGKKKIRELKEKEKQKEQTAPRAAYNDRSGNQS